MSKADFERSTEGWLSVRKEVSDRLEGLKQSNDSSKYSEMRPVASLLKVIDSEINAATEGGLKKANKAYADRYAAEPEVLDIGGIIQRIAKDRSLGASPIARIKEVYGATAIDSADIEAVSRYLPDDANRLGLRAGLGVSYNDKGDNPARALLKSDRIKNQMQRILPEQEVAQIRQLLNFENAINTNTQGLTQGSPTNSNQYSTIKEVLKKVPGVSLLSRLADDMQSRKTTDEYSKLANAMFRTGGEGSAVLDDVIRYMERADKIRPVDDTWRNFYLSSGRTMAPRILDVILGK
jgi:hypothetical protein